MGLCHKLGICPNFLTGVGKDGNVDAAEKFVWLLYGIEEKGVNGIENARHSLFVTAFLLLLLFGLMLSVPDTAMVMFVRSIYLITLFSRASLTKRSTSTSCTYFRL